MQRAAVITTAASRKLNIQQIYDFYARNAMDGAATESAHIMKQPLIMLAITKRAAMSSTSMMMDETIKATGTLREPKSDAHAAHTITTQGTTATRPANIIVHSS